MRKIVLAIMSTVAAVVMLFGYRTSTPNPTISAPTTIAAGSAPGTSSGTATTPPAPVSGSTSDGSTSDGSTSDGSSDSSSSGDSSTGSSSTDESRTVDGDAAQTRWGPVQVQITVVSGTVTAVDLLQVPAGNGRDVQINNYAVPVLVDETLQAQSADIDSVSGATVTSDGYISSLQSALDAAGL